MQKTNFFNATTWFDSGLIALVAMLALAPATACSAQPGATHENLQGYYSREGNDGSPADTAGNNIYIKFFADRWLGVMFVPYPYSTQLAPPVIVQVFEAARKQVSSAALLKGKFELLEQAATLQIERYGYLEDRVVFECGALSPCTIRFDDDSLELIKPGIINEHIIKYRHVATP